MLTKFKTWALKKIFKSIYKPGSYYSTVPDINWIRSRANSIFVDRRPRDIKGIDLNVEEISDFVEANMSLLEVEFAENKTAGKRYFANNIFFNRSDAAALQFVIRKFSPKRIIEVGSGFSSALMLDTRDQYYSKQPFSILLIEPYPDRLYSLLSENDKGQVSIVTKMVQEISQDEFMKLEDRDLLFIDSSHVSKVGSDLNYLLFEILPNLRKGVIVHFHDIFFPFEYPASWFEMGISWNEVYLLRSFLMFNNAFKVMLFNDAVGRFGSERLASRLGGGGSLYLQKIV